MFVTLYFYSFRYYFFFSDLKFVMLRYLANLKKKKKIKKINLGISVFFAYLFFSNIF